MAGNATAYLQLAPFPSGISNQSKNTRSLILRGTMIPALTTTPAFVQIVSFSITSNVATIVTTANAFTGGGADVINISGAPAAFNYLNGKFTTNSATSTTVLIPLTHANVASTATTGLITLDPNYGTGGIPISYGFLNAKGQVISVAGIGPLARPKWIQFQTYSGSTANYKVNLTGATSDLLLVFTGITEASDATAIPYDQVEFRAEFTFGAF